MVLGFGFGLGLECERRQTLGEALLVLLAEGCARHRRAQRLALEGALPLLLGGAARLLLLRPLVRSLLGARLASAPIGVRVWRKIESWGWGQG